MAYEPTVWNCGDTITAEKLNKLENGLAECCGGGTEPLIAFAKDNELVDASSGNRLTFADFQEARAQGRLVLAKADWGAPLSAVVIDDYYVSASVVSFNAYDSCMMAREWELESDGTYTCHDYYSPSYTAN